MCHAFADVDVSVLAGWISTIDFAEWPQQRPVDHQFRPAMVSDRSWHRFGEITNPIIDELMGYFPGAQESNRLLSVVMPGHDIEPHKDLQASTWQCRVHVPIVSNLKALWVEGHQYYWMRPGTAYKIDTTVEHSVINAGDTPRIHFMFDVT